MTLRSFVPRRPSAALLVSFVALFIALGGAGYAAFRLPKGSVGTAQLKNFSVSNPKLAPNSVGARKIIAGTVGSRQVNANQVQRRVTGPCSVGAIQSIAVAGNVTCTPVLPNEYGTSVSAVTLGEGSTQIASQSLPSRSSYLVLAYPHVKVSGASGAVHVEVDCTLSVPQGAGATNTLALDTSGTSDSQAATIPLVLAVPAATSTQTAAVSCSDTATPSTQAPAVTADAMINAIQTASNN